MESLAIAGFAFLAALLAAVFIVAVATHSIADGAHGACSASTAYRCSDASLANLCSDRWDDANEQAYYCAPVGKGN